MTPPLPDRSGKSNRRKEPRYKTSDTHCLRCRTSIDTPGKDRIWEGTTVDISSSGIRLLSSGSFQVGQPIWTELLTSRSHGVYRGNIRRIEPWVGGQVILGCSLRDTIPEEVLQELAAEGIINRRTDGRFSISHPAKINWPLCTDEIAVEIRDYSSCGLKLQSTERIPQNGRLRVRFEADGHEVTLEARSVWSHQTDQGWFTGVSLADRDAPTVIAATLGKAAQGDDELTDWHPPGKARQILTLAAVLALVGYMVLMTS